MPTLKLVLLICFIFMLGQPECSVLQKRSTSYFNPQRKQVERYKQFLRYIAVKNKLRMKSLMQLLNDVENLLDSEDLKPVPEKIDQKRLVLEAKIPKS